MVAPTSLRRAVIATAVAAVVTALVVPAVTSAGPSSSARPAAQADAAGNVFINELHYDNAGTDVGEAIEIAAPAGTALSGWTIVLYNGNGGAPYGTLALGGVVADEAGGFGTTVVLLPTNGVQNGPPDGLSLVDRGGVVVQFLSYEGTFTAAGGPADGLVSTDIGVLETGNEPAGQSLALTGTGTTYDAFAWTGPAASSFDAPNPGQTFGDQPTPTTSSTDVTTSTTVPGDTTTTAAPTSTSTTSPPPATTTTTTTTTPPTGPCAVAPTVTPIGIVQGPAETSPCVTRIVVVEGVVVGDYEGAAPNLRGFYVQSADGARDGDDATSEGVFVFNGDADSVALGDIVRVTGRVSEFQGQTQLSAQTTTVVDTDATVTAVALSLPVPSATFLERTEGMLVSFAQALTVTEHFQLGRFGQIVVSGGGRLRQPTAVAEPGADAAAVAAANASNRLIVDDASQGQNPDPIVFGRGGLPLTASNTLRGGDTVSGLVGVMTYTWGGNTASPNAYRLRPINDLSDTGVVPGGVVPAFTATNPRPTVPPVVEGDLRVANFNVLNYFLTLDAGTNQCGPIGNQHECRGAETALELQRQRTKLLAALASLDADVIGLIELENTTGVEPMADIVAGLNAAVGAGTYDFIETGTIGTDAIKVGIVYRPAVVTAVANFEVIDETVDPRFVTTRNRPSLAQSFAETASGEIMTVVVT